MSSEYENITSRSLRVVPNQEPPRCRCGHPGDAHEHLRPGSDCSQCPCMKYKKDRKEIKCKFSRLNSGRPPLNTL
jgi:hypothetical protein